MLRNINIDLVYQPSIDAPPAQQGNLYDMACRSDAPTVEKWKDLWLKYTQTSKERFGSFADHSIGKLYGINRNQPVIICGSGPSLKYSIETLKENAISPHPVLNVSCLHNFGYFEDEGFHADYYLSLDSGDIVVRDVFEGRKQPPEHYWAQTKGKKLLATVATDPKLFDLWQGEIFLFAVLIPDREVQQKLQEIEVFSHYVSSGGNALGGCFYVAKSIFCSDAIHFVGADFCFDYDNKFHSYQTHYDNLGGYVLAIDVFGNMRKTWPSYLNFKFWFDHIACTVPGRYINCSEGLLGAYREGNIKQFEYKSLKSALQLYRQTESVTLHKTDLTTNAVTQEKIDLAEYFRDSKFKEHIVLF